jgi:hypothetical protein
MSCNSIRNQQESDVDDPSYEHVSPTKDSEPSGVVGCQLLE